MFLCNNQKDLGNYTFSPLHPTKETLGVAQGLSSKRGIYEKLGVCLLKGEHSADILEKGRIWIYGTLNVNTI